MSKYTFMLAIPLVVSWLLWSGHFDEQFILAMGVLSVLFSLVVSNRMKIVDEESAPAHLGLRPFTWYAPWLAKEILKSNVEVTRMLLQRTIPLQRNVVEVTANQKSEIGKVILANSITLTPGTVSVKVEGDKILVHSVSEMESEDDLSGEMGDRIRRMESGS